MRVFITCFSLIIILGLVVLINSSIYSKNARKHETEQSLRYAVDNTIDTFLSVNDISISNADEMIASLCRHIILQITSDSEITVNILDVDFHEGLIDIEVVETFRYPNGKKGEVSYRRTVIVDKITL